MIGDVDLGGKGALVYGGEGVRYSSLWLCELDDVVSFLASWILKLGLSVNLKPSFFGTLLDIGVCWELGH